MVTVILSPGDLDCNDCDGCHGYRDLICLYDCVVIETVIRSQFLIWYINTRGGVDSVCY